MADYKVKKILWPEGVPALVIGAGGAFALAEVTELSSRVALMPTLLQVSAAFLAIVFTALAIMVALPSGRYLSALQKDDPESDGMASFLSPFLVAVGTQIVLLIIGAGYILAADHVSAAVEHASFCLLGFLFVYGLLDIAALARALVKHGIMRAQDAAREYEEQQNVRSLPQRRSG
ncbi:MAG TPA: hypothetical protein VFX35_09865 [Solirubrobacterales bacterium]|nr:hypothetical protein [Solirubrobacterales bacterium]